MERGVVFPEVSRAKSTPLIVGLDAHKDSCAQANATCSNPLETSNQPMITVTAALAKAGAQIATTPAAIISTLNAIDHVASSR